MSGEQRQLVFQLSDSISEVCRSLEIDLYEPRKKTDPVNNPNVRDSDVFQIDRERVLGSDLVIHLAHYPSTGAGEELDMAYGGLVPILIVAHEDTTLVEWLRVSLVS